MQSVSKGKALYFLNLQPPYAGLINLKKYSIMPNTLKLPFLLWSSNADPHYAFLDSYSLEILSMAFQKVLAFIPCTSSPVMCTISYNVSVFVLAVYVNFLVFSGH